MKVEIGICKQTTDAEALVFWAEVLLYVYIYSINVPWGSAICFLFVAVI